MDLSKLTTSDRLIVGGGLVYLTAMFLPWYGVDGTGLADQTGWDYFVSGILPLILLLVMTGQVLLTRFSPQTKLPDPPLAWGRVHLIAGALAGAILILRVIIASDVDTDFGDFAYDRKFGVFVAAIGAIAAGVGGYHKSQEPA